MTISPINEKIVATIDDISSDKSISHRCAIFSLLSDKTSKIKNFLFAEDTKHTLNIVKKLGAKVEIRNNIVFINPPKFLKEPSAILDCGNSGTSIRIFMGLLAGYDGFFVLSGDKYLNERPMKRISEPLKRIGAEIFGRDNANKAPICIKGNSKLKYFEYENNISSAQVKTALILAALNNEGCKIKESKLSRNHSEKILAKMGADIETYNSIISVKAIKSPLRPIEMEIPSDPSSAFYFAILACIIPDSNITIKNVLLNKTRIEAFKVLRQMGAKINIYETSNNYESVGDINIKYSILNAIELKDNISWLIDEIPALAIAFACANGTSILRNAKELRVKESDRIKSVVSGLKNCNIHAKELEDGFEIIGGIPAKGNIDSFGDHRIAMSFAILGLKCGMNINDVDCIKTSFPNFIDILERIGAKIEN